MFRPQAIRQTARALSQTQTIARRTFSAAPAGPVRQFFSNGVPVDVYPLLFLTGGVTSFALYSISKHVLQDRDHLRWLPGQGGVKYEIKSE